MCFRLDSRCANPLQHDGCSFGEYMYMFIYRKKGSVLNEVHRESMGLSTANTSVKVSESRGTPVYQ